MRMPSINHRDDHLVMQPGRQPCDITLTEDVLALVNDHEHHEYYRYHWLSLRFLTYNLGLSRLMQALADESKQRIQALIEQSTSLSLGKPAIWDPSTSVWQAPTLPSQSHFFILDDDTAAQELSRALLDEWRSRRFYERLQAYNGTPQLDAWLNACISQAQAQFQVLQETEWLLPAIPRQSHEMTWPDMGHSSRSKAPGGRRSMPGRPGSNH
ncbi:hypothetical protein [Halomonas daqiaonensis]|uniref:Uncharacterized protein n=1 Tax=Halomonas daqiaonensis TaxID=650850 RepID=A0A1H7FK17_9GAMM|nr:hypothetical protein [Halomonas daqiaonensis]SEK24470.1 hypothetical protein SAMN04488129_101108 [Halomonas daqiaonensis]